MFPAVVEADVRPGAAPGVDEGDVDQDDMVALSDDFPQRPVQAWGPHGEQFDHLHHPAAHRGRGAAVAARHVGEQLVMTENGEDDRGDPPGR
ncbi:hypothetical protein GCM10010339_60080 [Streptomyces alanosinicus]|uniref:Uncharacterized protein n=1 Tax=Streptomyces alanosinicus TaxID=68171 RepID=A0A918YNH8_9ACTN|nr:hypothetical protein GCM10010339_60080 [Streptomyces alanosinicus]